MNLHTLRVFRLLSIAADALVVAVELERLALAEQLEEEAPDLARAAVLDGRRAPLLHPPVQVEGVQQPTGWGRTRSFYLWRSRRVQ